MTKLDKQAASLLRGVSTFFKENPAGWTRGANARNAAGIEVMLGGKDATCFCVIGRMTIGCPTGKAIVYQQARRALLTAVGAEFGTVSRWNDAQTFVEPIIKTLNEVADQLEVA